MASQRPDGRWDWLAGVGLQSTPHLINLLDASTTKLQADPANRITVTAVLTDLGKAFQAVGATGDSLQALFKGLRPYHTVEYLRTSRIAKDLDDTGDTKTETGSELGLAPNSLAPSGGGQEDLSFATPMQIRRD